MARAGLYSRRQAEELIAQGKVFVDGKKVTVLGTKVDAHVAKIRVKGKPLVSSPTFIYALFHKPKECVVTRSDPEGRNTIYDFLPAQMKNLKPVGRLDYHSEGLLMLTNDGELANKLTHPRFHMNKVYEVKVQPKPAPRQLDRLRAGIMLDGRRTLPTEVSIVRENPETTWIEMKLEEGRNRQIRRMCEKVNLTVKTLVRTQMGPFKLKGIPYGKWIFLPPQVVSSVLFNP